MKVRPTDYLRGRQDQARETREVLLRERAEAAECADAVLAALQEQP